MTADAADRRPTGRRVLDGAFSVLDALAGAGPDAGLGLTEIARRSRLPKATTHRLLDQLVDLGAAERLAGRYRVGPRLFDLGRWWQPYPGLIAAVGEPMRQLATATAGSVLTSVLRDGQAFVVDTVPGVADPIATVRPGMRLAPRTAAAMALLDPSAPGGLAVDDRSVLPDVTCVAAPVHAPGGAVIASVCVMMVRLVSIRPVADAVRGAVRQAELALRRQVRPVLPDPAGPRWLLGT